MRAGLIWWTQIGNSIRFIDEIANALRDGRTTLIDTRHQIPWKDEFCEAIDARRAADTGNRRLIRKEWQGNEEPGRFVLDNVCSREEQIEYYPKYSYAKYLAGKMAARFIWITGIHTKADAKKWIAFIRQYEDAAEGKSGRDTFILEYDGPDIPLQGINSIQYQIRKYDCRVFAMASAATVGNTKYVGYQAELAISLAGDDPQLCWELIMQGNNLMIDPVGAVNSIKKAGGRGMTVGDIQTINSHVWRAGLIHLFPIIEQYRAFLIKRYDASLRGHLPIENAQGEKIDAPEDLEIGNMWYLANRELKLFKQDDYQALKVCREIRNLLAHNKPVPFAEVEKLYVLENEYR